MFRASTHGGRWATRGRWLIALLVPLAVVLTSCDWSQFRLGASHSGDNETERAISTSNVSTLTVDYTAAAGSTTSSPAVASGVVYIGSIDHNLYAFDANGNTNCSGTPKTCAPLWTASTVSFIDSSPTVANGVVYIGSSGSADHNFFAFDATGNTNCSGTPKTCAPLWIGSTGNVDSSPAVSNGMVYVGDEDGNLSVFDAAGTTNCSGVPKVCTALWTYQSSGGAMSPAVVNGVVYDGDALDNVAAFDAAGQTNCSGTPKMCQHLWTTDLNSAQQGIFSSPAVAHGTVYIGNQCNLSGPFVQPLCNNPPYFYALNAATGAVRWTAINSLAPILSSPAVANGLVFVGSGDGNLYAFDAAGNLGCSGTPTSCSPLWSFDTGGPVNSSPAIANGKVYVAGGGGGGLYVFGLP
jgi:outer membrane protein assembly factor BamB